MSHKHINIRINPLGKHQALQAININPHVSIYYGLFILLYTFSTYFTNLCEMISACKRNVSHQCNT